MRHVFEILRGHKHYVKESKCSFGTTSILYLDHIISAKDVEVNVEKINVMIEWPIPIIAKAL